MQERQRYKLRSLENQYALLSRLTEFFPKISRHKAFLEIEKTMNETLTEIENTKEPELINVINAPYHELIAVHTGKARSSNYFYDYSSELEGWVRGEKISEKLKKAYKNPLIKSNYK